MSIGPAEAGFFAWNEDEAIANGEALRHDASALVIGDASKILHELPRDIVQTAITSPPYWFVRNCSIDGQIGLEQELDDYIHSLVVAFTDPPGPAPRWHLLAERRRRLHLRRPHLARTGQKEP